MPMYCSLSLWHFSYSNKSNAGIFIFEILICRVQPRVLRICTTMLFAGSKPATSMALAWPFILQKSLTIRRLKRSKKFLKMIYIGTVSQLKNPSSILWFAWIQNWKNFWKATILHVSHFWPNFPFTKLFLRRNLSVRWSIETSRGTSSPCRPCSSSGRRSTRTRERARRMLSPCWKLDWPTTSLWLTFWKLWQMVIFFKGKKLNELLQELRNIIIIADQISKTFKISFNAIFFAKMACL